MPFSQKLVISGFTIIVFILQLGGSQRLSAQSYAHLTKQTKYPSDYTTSNTITIGLLKGQHDSRELIDRLQSGNRHFLRSIETTSPFEYFRYSEEWIGARLVRNNFINPRAVQTIFFRYFDTDTELITAFHFGEVEYAVLYEKRLLSLMFRDAEGLRIIPMRLPANTVDMVVYNLNHPALKHVDVRKAISYSIRKKEIEEDILEGQGVVAEGSPYEEDSPYFPGWEGIEKYRYSPRRGVTMLRNNGWKLNDEEIFEKNGQPIIFRLFFKKGIQLERKIATKIKRDLALRGMQVNLVGLTMNEINDHLAAGDFDAVLWQKQFEERDMAIYEFFVNPQTSFIQLKDDFFDRSFNRTMNLPMDKRKPGIDHLQVITNQKCLATYLVFRWWQYHIFNHNKIEQYYDVEINPIDAWRVTRAGNVR